MRVASRTLLILLTAAGVLVPTAAQATTGHALTPARVSLPSFFLGLHASAKAQHSDVTLHLSPGACAKMKQNLQRLEPQSAVKKAKCEIGIALTVRPASAPRHLSAGMPRTPNAAATWYYKNVTGTICYGNHLYWGGRNGTLYCTEAYETVAGEFAYNGYNAWEQWLSCSHGSSYPFNVSQSWCGVWNNGAYAPYGYLDLGANGAVTVTGYGSSGFWVRIDCYKGGGVHLRGGGFNVP